MKKVSLLLLVLLLMCSMMLSAQGAQEVTGETNKAKTITLATGDAAGSLRNLAGWHFKELLDSQPELNITVNHVEGAVLGSAGQIMDQVVEGSVQLFGNDIAWLVPYDKDFQPISFGFMFKSTDHMKKYFTSPLFLDITDKVAADAGLRALAPVPMGSRMFFSTVKLNTAADFKGLKIRAPGLEMFIKSYEAYGASPTTVAWNEIFLALKTGLVKAAHGPVADVIANKWHLAAPYITNAEDMYAANCWFVHEAFWQELSNAQRDGLAAALEATNKWTVEQNNTKEKEIIKQMESEGAMYSVFQDRETLRVSALDAVKKLEESGKWSKGLVDKIQQL